MYITKNYFSFKSLQTYIWHYRSYKYIFFVSFLVSLLQVYRLYGDIKRSLNINLKIQIMLTCEHFNIYPDEMTVGSVLL